ncbi:hypothetical protein C0995_009116 [Termitomyces sp. Mi166|nr:hypothetical protein C0995_009116 [Termitomyces sp. Mi166\
MDPPRCGATILTYDADPTVFDSGHLIEVKYDCNGEIEDSEENKAMRERASLRVDFIHNEVLPRLNKPLPLIARVSLKTTRDSILVVPVALEVPQNYPSIPSALSLPRVPISWLQRLRQLSSAAVDLVTIGNGGIQECYVFKHPHSLRSTRNTSLCYYDTSLLELEQLIGIRSPFIALPQFIVTDTTGELYRGFLLPFLPAGSLSEVLKN